MSHRPSWVASPPFLSPNQVHLGDARDLLLHVPDASVDCCITSPPYWRLRDYSSDECVLGVEPDVEIYIENLVELFAGVHRVLKNEGSLWLNLGDTFIPKGARGYAATAFDHRGAPRTSKKLSRKNLVGVPWRMAFALQKAGWILRSDIVWSKPNPFPEPIQDRPTRSHEYVFLLTKRPDYYFDPKGFREPVTGRQRRGTQSMARPERLTHQNRDGTPRGSLYVRKPAETRRARSVWTIPNTGERGRKHPAPFPEALVERCMRATCPPGGVVFDPFGGSGTVGAVAKRLGRQWLLFEENAEFAEHARNRIEGVSPPTDCPTANAPTPANEAAS